MKKIFLSIIAITGLCIFLACNNGDYVANPTAISNYSANPLSFISDTAYLKWAGIDAVSAKINGTLFNCDSTKATWFLDTAGYNTIAAYTDAGHYHGLVLRFRNVYEGGIYPFGTLTNFNTERVCVYYDSVTRPVAYTSALGNVGEVYIVRNDTTSVNPRIIGRFYFQALDAVGGNVINVYEGWFNLPKH